MKLATLVGILAAVLLGGCDSGQAKGGTLTVAMMPKSKGNAYFIACKKGADEAAKELGVKLIWDGPTDPDPAGQNNIVDGWITRGVDVIAVAVENREGMSSVLKKARGKGIKVVTWDADSTTGRPGPLRQSGDARRHREDAGRSRGPHLRREGASTRSSRPRSPPATWSSGRRRSRNTTPRNSPT